MKTRSKAAGAAAGIAAIALSVPLAVNADADPAPTPTPSPTTSVTNEIPDLQGSGCDAFKQELPSWKTLATLPVSKAIASIPELTTFNAAISGQLNPAVNITSALDNGPYVVFAPTNDAFAELAPGQLDALKADPAKLSDLVYYHEFLGLLGPDDVKGQRPTQQGADIKVSGSGGDIKINDNTKVLCGAIHAENARIYLINSVLDPATPPDAVTPSSTSSTSTTTTTTTSAPATPAPMPAADAPIG